MESSTISLKPQISSAVFWTQDVIDNKHLRHGSKWGTGTCKWLRVCPLGHDESDIQQRACHMNNMDICDCQVHVYLQNVVCSESSVLMIDDVSWCHYKTTRISCRLPVSTTNPFSHCCPMHFLMIWQRAFSYS